MIFVPTPLAGAFVVELKRLEDDRGFFARSFCRDEFRARGLNPEVWQCNVSFNPRRGTLRGMHFQADPYAEDKLIRCTRGIIWDVIVDLRADSPGYRKWFGAELSAESRRALYVPKGFAHGFQTLADDAEVLYMMSESYHPESARGVRWDDPAIGIEWPLAGPSMSDKDRSYPLLKG
ncbi:MAG: dTDP-4-dehydrorhamnose 3,5-epimerase [Betaproteobacteria bacterium]|nr:dTDP-4-dehydrorhamnose 3,5-epimerase [Betaproteobacteria bacterium]